MARGKQEKADGAATSVAANVIDQPIVEGLAGRDPTPTRELHRAPRDEDPGGIERPS